MCVAQIDECGTAHRVDLEEPPVLDSVLDLAA
jgi:hypothetical protein